jgi:hypothetical protein
LAQAPKRSSQRRSATFAAGVSSGAPKSQFLLGGPPSGEAADVPKLNP